MLPAPLSDASLHLAIPASCSGFNLLLTAAYSYIVNPDLDTSQAAFQRYRRRDAEKRRRFFFICTSSLHLEDCAKSVPCIRTTEVRLHRCTGCAGDRAST
jgi:hypothetical protein